MGESNPVTGNTCDNVKQRAALIDCLAPDRRVEIEVKGIKDVVTQPQACLFRKPRCCGVFLPLVN